MTTMMIMMLVVVVVVLVVVMVHVNAWLVGWLLLDYIKTNVTTQFVLASCLIVGYLTS